MGFTIANYSLFGLQPQTFYVSIQGNYTIRKNHPVLGHFTISYVVYYSSSKAQPVIMKTEQYFGLEQLPEPANIYTAIYDNIKKNISPQYITVDD
jgi:hypothetical protein